MTTGQAIDPTIRTLRTVGPLLERLLEQVGGLRARPDGPASTAWEAPLPFNGQAFDDANDLFEVLVTTVEYEAAWLREPAPRTIHLATWRNAAGKVIGLRAGTTPAAGRLIATELTTWLEERLPQLEDQALTALTWTVRAKAARYPYSDRPSRSKTAVCASCSGSLLITPPRWDGDDRRIACESCARTYSEDDYALTEARYAAVLAAGKRQATRARRIEHLANRYAAQITAAATA